MAGDIAYVPTKKGVLYLAVFLDIYSRKGYGWSMGKKMKDTLLMDAFMPTYGKERSGEGLMVHTVRESQLTSGNFQTLLRTHRAVSSVSRKGTPYDNALMEQFYKKESSFRMSILKHLNKLSKRYLSISNYITTQRECIPLLGMFPLPNSRSRILKFT